MYRGTVITGHSLSAPGGGGTKQKFHYLNYITVCFGHQLPLPICLQYLVGNERASVFMSNCNLPPE
jgi:hypothetical protein